MAFEKVKRNQYFDPPTEFPHSSRNHAEDMEDFHLPMDRMHHAHLHDRGIARGLEVSGTIGGTEVVVNAGLAIDGEGRLIVLATDGFGDIGANPPGGDNEEVDVPVPLTTGSHSDQTVYVTIQFSEILRIEEGSGGRREQVPWLRLQPVAGSEAFVDDGASIILAIVVIDADGNLSQLKNQDGALPFRRRLIGETTEELRIRRGDKIGDSIQEVLSGKISPGKGAGLRITVPDGEDGILLAQEDGDNFSDLEVRANTFKINGKLGIETATPEASLHVAQDARVDGNLQVNGSADLSNGTVTDKLSLSRTDVDSSQWPTLSAGASSRADVNGHLRVAGDTDLNRNLTINTNVGIGTNTPEKRLHIRGANEPTLKIQSDGSNEISGRISLRQNNNRGVDIFYDGRNRQDGLAIESFTTNNRSTGVRVFVKNNGNVGIGTTTPGATLHISGTFRLNEGTTFSGFKTGRANVGSSRQRVRRVTIVFSRPFPKTPSGVIATARGQDHPDTFAVTTRSITNRQFVFNVARVDDGSRGWGQKLKLDWMAWW